jgi:hypothetical protein
MYMYNTNVQQCPAATSYHQGNDLRSFQGLSYHLVLPWSPLFEDYGKLLAHLVDSVLDIAVAEVTWTRALIFDSEYFSHLSYNTR